MINTQPFSHPFNVSFVIIQSLTHVQLFATPWTTAFQASLSFIISSSLLKFMSIDSVMLSSYLISSAKFFSICLQSFPPSGSFPVSRLYASGGQSIIASALASVFPMFIQGWFLLNMTGLISLLSLSRVFSSTTIRKHQFFSAQPSVSSNSSHLYITNGKIIVLTIRNFVGKVMALFFNMLSRFVIAFLARSKGILISCCIHCPQWFWNIRRENLSLFPLFPLLFATK